MLTIIDVVWRRFSSWILYQAHSHRNVNWFRRSRTPWLFSHIPKSAPPLLSA
jgi:hypothetical protein